MHRHDLFKSPQERLDPLEREILERTLDDTLVAVREDQLDELDSDEGLEAILRRELVEIACVHCVSDQDNLRNLVLTRLAGLRPEA
jgi:hypothetical protein